MNKNRKGFTLIELLVVIAIIGILATIVMVSLNTARQKARDTRRVSDVRQIQLALQMYYDSTGSYPAALASSDTELAKYLTVIPTDPNGAAYSYAVCTDSESYTLGATLENDNTAFDSDIDADTCGSINCVDASPDYGYCVQP